MTNTRANPSSNGGTKTASKTNDIAAKAPNPLRTNRPSKQQLLVDLLVRDQGATINEVAAATGWLSHTTRAALTGLKKKGYSLSSDKIDGVRTYRAVAPE